MYKYSPIKKVYIKNFRNIGEVTLEFDESPIISLIGDNEAGKTSCVKAFAVCALHAWARDQKDYIRDGTNGFGIAIELEDGTLITRIKTSSLNKYSIKYPNNEEWETNKIDSGFPVQVNEIMGIVEEPETKEFLQIRTYEDQLLFVVSPASTNYKVMYDALRVDQLTRAIKVGSLEVNSLRTQLSNNEISIDTLMGSIRNLRDIDVEPLKNVKNRLIGQIDILNKLEKAKDIYDDIKRMNKLLGNLSLIDKHNVTEINIAEFNKLNYAYNMYENVVKLTNLSNRLKGIDTLESIEINLINKLKSAVDSKNAIENKNNTLRNIQDTYKLTLIDTNVIENIRKCIDIKQKIIADTRNYSLMNTDSCTCIDEKEITLLKKLSECISMCSRNNSLINANIQLEDYINKMSNYLKQCGAKVISCPKCGESIVIENNT